MRFADWTGRGVRVAVVGIDPTHERIGPVAAGVSLLPGAGNETGPKGDISDHVGHGTACAGIIRRKAPQAELFSICIFDEFLKADCRSLGAAIDWAVDHRMDVVNLSLGTTDPAFREELAQTCRRAREAGLILVAAGHNEGLESYPAVFPDVIGVTGARVRGRYGYYYREDQIECVARGDAQRVCWTEPRYVMVGGTSYAAPHVTGLVALIRQAYPGASLAQVRETLRRHSCEGEPESLETGPAGVGPLPPDRSLGAEFGWIRRAALYPFNKEMHAFVHNRDLLVFELTGIADPAGKGLVGKDAGEALGLPAIGVRIQSSFEAGLEGADTLILGYVDQLSRIGHKDVLRSSIQTALEKGLHVFSFHAVWPDRYGNLHELANSKGLRIEFPVVTSEEIERTLREETYGTVDVPVLGVFGTSPQQGKFTLQLALRRRLQQIGYRVGQIGTEHHSGLFGMDFALPIGYASPMELPAQYYPPFLDRKMRQLCHQKRPDLILIGGQSGTIPFDRVEGGIHYLDSIALLLGAQPDACILVVNSIDPDEFIQDTIDAIRVVAKASVIALALSDKEKHIRAAYGRSWVTPRQMTPQEIANRIAHLEDRFRLPAAEILSTHGQTRMVNAILSHFAAEKQEAVDV